MLREEEERKRMEEEEIASRRLQEEEIKRKAEQDNAKGKETIVDTTPHLSPERSEPIREYGYSS
ncbi:hypothetical protein A2U01_0040495, partial [Trifolium medium]|nr:hypothetical protein [Trifolium medium]